MVIVLIVGSLGSGKTELAKYLEKEYKFKIHSLDISYVTKNIKSSLLDAEAMKKDIMRESTFIAEEAYNNWEENRIIYPILIPEQLELLHKRSYSILIHITAPLIQRFETFQKKYDGILTGPISFEDFAKYDDFLNYKIGIDYCKQKAKVTISNTGSLEEMFKSTMQLEIITDKRFRPDWDVYFMKIAHIVKLRTNCMKRSVGALIALNNRIVSTGYNGTPFGLQNCFEGGCPRCNSNAKAGQCLDECNCIHAEENAVLECGIHRTKGGTIYTTTFPCLSCAKIILQAGLIKIVYDQEYVMESSQKLLKKAGIELKRIKLES